MKPQLKSAIGAALLTACVASVISAVPAQEAAVAPAAMTMVQYKIVAAGTFRDGNALEQELNRLAAQGWRVRTSIATGVILEK